MQQRHRHDPIARRTQRHSCADETAQWAAGNLVEEIELRQSMFEVFSGSEKRDHGDLCRAQKRMKQPCEQGAPG